MHSKEIVILADPKRIKKYKNGYNSYDAGLMAADFVYLLLTDGNIKRDKYDILQIVDNTIDVVKMYMNKKLM